MPDFGADAPRLILSRAPSSYWGRPHGERPSSYYSVNVICPCCHEYNHVGSVQGSRGQWRAYSKVGSRWSSNRRLRGTYRTVDDAARAILVAKNLPPKMFRK